MAQNAETIPFTDAGEDGIGELSSSPLDMVGDGDLASSIKEIAQMEGVRQETVKELCLAIVALKADEIRKRSKELGEQLQKRHSEARELQSIIKQVNNLLDLTKGEGNLDLRIEGELSSKELSQLTSADLEKRKKLRSLLKEAQKKGYEVNIKSFYNKEERENLQKNLKLSYDDLNLNNEMQHQELMQLIHERNDVFSMAKLALNSWHQSLVQAIRSFTGR